MSNHGHQAGGIVGFMTSLAYLTQLVGPKMVCVVWESGGSARRRAIFPGYKADRRPPKRNRYYEDDIPDTNENRIHQVRFLLDVLQHVPVCQLFIEDCEADDVIGYLCRNRFRDERKVIATSDQDYYQLLDGKTMAYSWTSKRFIGPAEVIEKFNISPENFVLAKAIAGDPSDNVPGVKGAGFKTVAKRFNLSGATPVGVNEIIDECAAKIGASKGKCPQVYSHIYNSSDIIKRNWRLMYLDVSNLAAMQMQKIDATVNSFQPSRNKMNLMRALIDEGLPAFDAHDFFSSFLAL